MNKFNLLHLVLLSLNVNIIAQTVESSASISKNILQIELESLYTVQKEDLEKIESWSIPSALFRFGLLNGLELQLNTPIIKEQLWENDHLVHSLNKFDDIQVGASINLWKENKLLPQASLMVRAILPTDSKFEFKNTGEIMSLNLSNTLTKNISFNYNLGYAKETDGQSAGFYIANISFAATSKIHFFAENFGDFNHQKLISHNLNIGGGYNFSDYLSLDISIANGLNHNMFYAGGIITWAINTKKN